MFLCGDDVASGDADFGAKKGKDPDDEVQGTVGFDDLAFDAAEGSFGYGDAVSFCEGNVGEALRVGGEVQDPDEVFHLFAGDFQQRPGVMVDEKTGVNLAGIDQRQRRLLPCMQEQQGVVSIGNIMFYTQLSQPVGDPLPLAVPRSRHEPSYAF